MRPSILFPLFKPVSTLKGIGAKFAKMIEKLAGGRVVDLYWLAPVGLIDRRFTPTIATAPHGKIATITVQVGEHLRPRTPKLPYRVRCYDDSGSLMLIFFRPREDWLKAQLPEGAVRVVSGRIEYYRDAPQMPHPDRILTPDEAAGGLGVEPVYPLTAGLTPRVLGKAIASALAECPTMPEWQDQAFLRRNTWPEWHRALWQLHHPETDDDLSPQHPARRRLAYDELLANQLALALVRAHRRRLPGRRVEGDGRLRAKVLAALPYRLTGAQDRAIAEIAADLASDQRMLRLLQGDVGSGKTLVALMSMLIATEAGLQSALMAPTEILARQHFSSLSPLAAAAGVSITMLTGRDKGRPRDKILSDLAEGQIDILVGTHAVFQDDVLFKDLGFVVVDEQHRFGVQQRLSLSQKGEAVDVLTMTATPIPRTLALTAYGDMDVSRLDEKPPGRRPIDTRVLPLDRLSEVIDRLQGKLHEGARVYWVCPLVEESELIDLAAAEERYQELSALFPGAVGLVHGRQKSADRDRAMQDFVEGRTTVLVATTVIEVGVDVPEATVMVIEHAERFGLAQLHQLRGRIGRGGRPGTCLLLYGQPFGENAKARLKIMRETEDGFRIAEEDLRLRGAGEVLGSRQSGLPEFRIAALGAHADLLDAARDDAGLIMTMDPHLEKKRGEALRTLLHLFERDLAARTLRSG